MINFYNLLFFIEKNSFLLYFSFIVRLSPVAPKFRDEFFFVNLTIHEIAGY